MYAECRELQAERRQARLERDRARRQAREAKRSGLVVHDLRLLGSLLEHNGGIPGPGESGACTSQPKSSAALASAAGDGSSEASKNGAATGSAPASRNDRRADDATLGVLHANGPTARSGGFARRRQQVADEARDRATMLVSEAARQSQDRRAGEREAARRALEALRVHAASPWSAHRALVEEAITADDAAGVRHAARRALWATAADAAKTRAPAGRDPRTAGSVCAAMAIIEWLPISAIRASRRRDSLSVHREHAMTDFVGG
jgi:hypothetical protein